MSLILFLAACGGPNEVALPYRPPLGDAGDDPADEASECPSSYIKKPGTPISHLAPFPFCLLDEPLCGGTACLTIDEWVELIGFLECPVAWETITVERCTGGGALGYFSVTWDDWLGGVGMRTFDAEGQLLQDRWKPKPGHVGLCCSGTPMTWDEMWGTLDIPSCTRWEAMTPADFGADIDLSNC